MPHSAPDHVPATAAGQTRPGRTAPAAFDVQRLRRDFPALHQQVHGRPLVYLDNAATTHKPRAVIEAVADFYERRNANVHRGLHQLSEQATEAYEAARADVADFLNACDTREIVFTRGATESINLVAHAWGRDHLRPGDEVLVTHMEHHANIVPWQLVCEATGARLRAAPIDDRGQLDLDGFDAMLTDRTKLVAISHVSNVLGTVNPVGPLTARAHEAGARVLIDGAQAVAHLPVDVTELGCDFYAFSGHKCFGPTGIGALYGRYDLLEQMPPYQSGGEMIDQVSLEGTTFAPPPMRFEAGTPNIAGAIGLAAAIGYLRGLDRSAVKRHEADLLAHGAAALDDVPGLRMIGAADDKLAIFSFVIDGVHPYDLAPLIDRQGVAVRTGHHCAQPLMERFGVAATVRASLAPYNTLDEIDALVAAIDHAREFLQ